MSKDKLVFACKWGKNRAVSWSGTHYSLFKHLQKYYDICDLNTGYNDGSFITKVTKLKAKIGSMISAKSYNDILDENIMKKIAGDKKIAECENVLQFEIFPDMEGKKQYIYQDLYWGHLKDLYYNNQDLFKFSGFKNIPEETIVLSEKNQKAAYEQFAGIFTMGNWMADEIVRKYNIPSSKVHHVGGGSNIDVSKIDGTSKNGKRFLFVGRDFERKNGPLVVEAFKKIYEADKSYELYIIGPEKIEYSCEGIRFLGNLNYDELVYYFNLCDVFCMPSKFEAYGLVFVEALIYGLPCIGRNAYEMPYFIEDGVTGYLLNDENAEKLSELMLKLINNKEIINNVLSKREYYIKEYSWDTVSERIYNIIKNK